MSGSATTVRWLLREGLLDELNLLVHPIVVGDGLARLFPSDEPSIPLELLSAQTFETGVLNPDTDCPGVAALPSCSRLLAQTVIRCATSYFATDVRRPGVSPAGIALSISSPFL